MKRRNQWNDDRRTKRRTMVDPRKFNRIWDTVPKHQRHLMQMDELSVYSVTPGTLADRITDIVIKYCDQDPMTMTITDATACVGGNTISFSKKFGKVNAVELDRSRFEK